jgi:hypothetical protein
MEVRTASKRRTRPRPPARADVQARANAYCLTTYGDAYVGATPRPLALPSGCVWVVSVMFTSPGYGPVGEVGVIALDGATLAVLDATPKEEVRAAGVRLTREKRDALRAAFHRARTF